MAMPNKTALDYYPRDIGMRRDRKFCALKIKYGSIAVDVYEILLDLIYGDKGYYVKYDEKSKINVLWDIAQELQGKGCPEIDTIESIVDDLVKAELFSEKYYNKGILTSHRIQTVYYKVTIGRKVCQVDFSLWLLTEQEMADISERSAIFAEFQNRFNFGEDESILKQSKEKESKVNKSKVNNSKENPAEPDKAEAQADDKVKNLFDYYENNIGNVTPYIENQITEYINRGAEPALIQRLIDYSAAENKKKWSYINGCISGCLRDGIKTAAEYEQSQARRAARKAKNGVGNNIKTGGFNNYTDTNKIDYAALEEKILEQMLM